MTVHALAADAQLPLTCTREGVCCHGHIIWVNPWEVAVMANGMGLEPTVFRDRYLDCGGTRLIFDGPPDHRGKTACRLYGVNVGCTLHPHRPLTCRVYPLGRARIDGQIRYHHASDGLPCLTLCPTVTKLPTMTVADYLAGQQVAASETAHDAYARMIYGLAAIARQTCSMGTAKDRTAAIAFLNDRITVDPAMRSALLPESWRDLATMPSGLPLAEPERFAVAHGERIVNTVVQTAMSGVGSVAEATILYLAIFIHLAPTIGADLVAVRQLFESA